MVSTRFGSSTCANILNLKSLVNDIREQNLVMLKDLGLMGSPSVTVDRSWKASFLKRVGY